MAVDYGTGLDCRDDIPRRWVFVNGKRNLGNAVYRRLTTMRGAFKKINGDADYGLDVRGMLLDGMTKATVARWQSDIDYELRKDDRIRRAPTTITPAPATNSAIVAIMIYPDDDSAPFALVLGVSALAVAVLEAP